VSVFFGSEWLGHTNKAIINMTGGHDMADTDTNGARRAPFFCMDPKEAYEALRGWCVEWPLMVAVDKLVDAGTPFSFSALIEAMEEVTGAATPERLSAIRKFLVSQEESTSRDIVKTLAAFFENDKDTVITALAVTFLRTPEGASAFPPYEAA
jgi:hypothetical protein